MIKPKYLIKDIYCLDDEFLKLNNAKGVIFDIDNTLVHHGDDSTKEVDDLFVLIGNLQSIPFFNSLFKQWIIGNEVIFGVISSQIISNVPAAILLSGFSTNYEAIIVGINIGGLGTLIASMANLISYKILAREFNDFKIRYFIVFTVLNIVLLIILLAVYILIN